jgi:hypothetical protein
MRYLLALVVLFLQVMFLSQALLAQTFSCPSGQIDVMKYFAMTQSYRETEYMNGSKNPLYTKVFPDEDFPETGYWFWLKSATANGFDVKAFDGNYVYMRATELIWTNNTTFKRFVNDLPISARCVSESAPGPEIKVSDTSYQYYSSCQPYKESNLGTAVNDLDKPVLMNAGGNIGQVWTRVLRYNYNCNANFQQCTDQEQFYLANGYGEWQWRHYHNGALVSSTVMNYIEPGTTNATLPCPNCYSAGNTNTTRHANKSK